MSTVIVGGLAVAGLVLLAGIAMGVKQYQSRKRARRTAETPRALDSCVERFEQIAERLENVLGHLEQLMRGGLEDGRGLQRDLRLGAAGSAQHRSTIRPDGSVRLNESSVDALDAPDDVVQSLMSQLDRQPMTLLQVRECAAQHGRQMAVLAPVDSRDWLLGALSAGSGDRWFVLPRLHIAMGDVRLIDYFDLHNYNGVDPLRARDITAFARVEKTSHGWNVVSRGRIDVQTM